MLKNIKKHIFINAKISFIKTFKKTKNIKNITPWYLSIFYQNVSVDSWNTIENIAKLKKKLKNTINNKGNTI